MRRQRYIKGADLREGDRIVRSESYAYRVTGVVRGLKRGNSLTFVEQPTLPDEDVAFRDDEQLLVTREE